MSRIFLYTPQLSTVQNANGFQYYCSGSMRKQGETPICRKQTKTVELCRDQRHEPPRRQGAKAAEIRMGLRSVEPRTASTTIADERRTGDIIKKELARGERLGSSSFQHILVYGTGCNGELLKTVKSRVQ